MIIKHEAAAKVTTEKPKGGDGIMTGVQYINADSRPNPTRIWMATINTLPPGAGLAFHAHEVNEECFFILEGDAVYTDGDGKEYPITKGDFTLCRQGEKHGIYNKSSAPLVFAAVIMDSGQ